MASEESRFNETLNDGLNLLNNLIAETKQAGQDTLAGKDAFKLYDTYGFPFELTKEYAGDEDLDVDEAGFEVEMKAQRDRARNARSSAKSMGVQRSLLIDIKTPSEYVGYDELTDVQGTLNDIIVDETLVDHVDSGQAEMIFSKTPFYAEMGGQVADRGVILDDAGQTVAKVTDVQNAPNKQHLHTVEVLKPMHKDTTYTLNVDLAFHNKVEKNHTATHLLDQALRDVLGEHTKQAGSLVEPDYLRFDFTHFGQVTDEELAKVEQIVNDKIWAALPVSAIQTDQKLVTRWGQLRSSPKSMAKLCGSFQLVITRSNLMVGPTSRTVVN